MPMHIKVNLYCLDFRRNVVIVKDSTSSEWLYVVKSVSTGVFTRFMTFVTQMKHQKLATSFLFRSFV